MQESKDSEENKIAYYGDCMLTLQDDIICSPRQWPDFYIRILRWSFSHATSSFKVLSRSRSGENWIENLYLMILFLFRVVFPVQYFEIKK